jgi:ketosteroid isomerase-like protein
MRTLSVVLLAAMLVAASGCAKKVDVAKEADAIRAADAAWSTAIGSKSAEEFMKFVDAEGMIMPPNSPAVAGSDAINSWVGQMLAMPDFSVSWTANNAVVAGSGDVGYTTGTYQSSMGGMPDNGKYVTIWKKQADGSWKVAVDMFNSDVPMPMPAPADTSAAQGQ